MKSMLNVDDAATEISLLLSCFSINLDSRGACAQFSRSFVASADGSSETRRESLNARYVV